ncbi:MAG: hypothetical protein GTO02_20785, partial [Candidatus Dadabacteria bacterium]|nr:hypothetical protein [Candidatus Dadabacteria bacterium]NIQ16727.1 hypothetical protein [Candidatus Dadabacteria bacterium]
MGKIIKNFHKNVTRFNYWEDCIFVDNYHYEKLFLRIPYEDEEERKKELKSLSDNQDKYDEFELVIRFVSIERNF